MIETPNCATPDCPGVHEFTLTSFPDGARHCLCRDCGQRLAARTVALVNLSSPSRERLFPRRRLPRFA